MVCDDLGLCALASFLKEQCILSILSKPSASKYDTISLNSHINKIESIDPLHSLVHGRLQKISPPIILYCWEVNVQPFLFCIIC